MRYSKYLGLKEVSKSILLMNYDTQKTLKENECYINEQTGIDFSTTEKNQEILRREQQKQQELKKDFIQKFDSYKIPIPNSASQNGKNVKDLLLPKGSKVKLFQKSEPRTDLFSFKNWGGTKWEKYIPSENDLVYHLPDNTLRSFETPDGEFFKGQIKRIKDNPPTYSFDWYYNENNEPYNQAEVLGDTEIPDDFLSKEGGFWDTWGTWITAGLSVLATILFPGSIGLWLSVAIDLTQAIEDLAKGNNMGAFISTILALLPVGIGKIPGIGTITKKECDILANKFVNAKTEAEIVQIYNGLEEAEKKAFQTVFSQDPEKLLKSLDTVWWQNLSQGLQTGAYDPKELVSAINKMIHNKVLKYDDLVKWYQKANIKRFGIDLASTGLILGGTYGYGKYKQSKMFDDKFDFSKRKPKNYSPEEYKQMDSDLYVDDD